MQIYLGDWVHLKEDALNTESFWLSLGRKTTPVEVNLHYWCMNHSQKGLILKERICFEREQILSNNIIPLSEGR